MKRIKAAWRAFLNPDGLRVTVKPDLVVRVVGEPFPEDLAREIQKSVIRLNRKRGIHSHAVGS